MSSTIFSSKVFDGHGKEGHTCALFCKEYLPEMLEENLLKLCRNDLDGQHLIEAAIYQSFLSCNNAIHNCTQVDDTLSGTTAVGILIDGHDMYIANVSYRSVGRQALTIVEGKNSPFGATGLLVL